MSCLLSSENVQFYPLPWTFFSKFWSLKKIWSEKYSQIVNLKKKTEALCILKDFYFLLVLEEKELKQLCLKKKTEGLCILKDFFVQYWKKRN